MSGAFVTGQRVLRTRLRGLMAAVSFAAFLPAMPAYGQEAGLRGAVSESAINDTLFGQAAYAPLSAESAPDAGAPADTAGSTLARPPSTAVRRRESVRDGTAAPATAVETTVSEEPETTGTVPVGPVESRVDLAPDLEVGPVTAIEGRDRALEEDPYAPLGIRAGSFILRPSVEQGLTATSNADFSANGSAAVLSETTLRLNAISDWDAHSAAFDGYGTFRKTISGEDIQDVEAGIDGAAVFELGNDYQVTGAVGYEIGPESASSPAAIEGTAEQPIRQIFGGSLGIEKDAGRLRLGLTGAVEREVYGNADLSTGGVLSQEDRNNTLSTVVLRGGYAISPAVIPFVEAEVGRRSYDLSVDSSGYARSSDRLGARAGVALDLGEKFSGEVAAGWIREEFDDERLGAVSGLAASAVLRWSPMRGTIVALTGATTVEGTTVPGESGSLLYAGQLAIDRQIRSNLTGNLVLGAAWRDYVGSDGHDLTLNAGAGLTWWLNRYTGLTGRVSHETVTSNLEGRDAETNSVFLGMRFQR